MLPAAEQTVTKRTRLSFTPDEDDLLRVLVGKYGEDNWQVIAAKMTRRSRRQCRERWVNYLSPAVCNRPWTPEEEDLLSVKVKEIGRKWKAMEPFFPGRTDVNIKNHWKQMEKWARTKPPPSAPAGDPFVMLYASWGQEQSEMAEKQTTDSWPTDPLW
jgi:hypothetical protein